MRAVRFVRHCRPTFVFIYLYTSPHGAHTHLNSRLQTHSHYTRYAGNRYAGNGRITLHIALEYDAAPGTIRALLKAYPHAASEVIAGTPHDRAPQKDTWLHNGAGTNGYTNGKTCMSKSRPYAAPGDPDLLPLHWALRHRAHADVIAALVEMHPRQAGDTPPLQAALMERAPASVIAAIMDTFPESACATDDDGLTPLHRAVGGALLSAVVAVLRKRPEAASIRDPNGNTALHHALQSTVADINVVRVLMCCEGEHFLPASIAPVIVPTDDPTFQRLRQLLSSSEPEVGCPEGGLQVGEVCPGWTALSLAASISGGWPALQWLLQQHTAGSIGPHGNPELLNRHAVNIARMSRNQSIRNWGDGYGRLLQRYSLAAGEPQHRSATCVVIFATDRDENERLVALKFMSDEPGESQLLFLSPIFFVSAFVCGLCMWLDYQWQNTRTRT
jgi:hypothetical protein